MPFDGTLGLPRPLRASLCRPVWLGATDPLTVILPATALLPGGLGEPTGSVEAWRPERACAPTVAMDRSPQDITGVIIPTRMRPHAFSLRHSPYLPSDGAGGARAATLHATSWHRHGAGWVDLRGRRKGDAGVRGRAERSRRRLQGVREGEPSYRPT
jgi:hypothetical protein